MASEWSVCNPVEKNGWVHKFMLDTHELKILDFEKYDILSWLAELMKHRDADTGRRYKVLAPRFIEKYQIPTEGYDVIKRWRANASYFYIAKCFVRDEVDMYEKAILFQDQQTAEKILGTDDVAEIKTLGRMVQNFDEEIWREKREKIVHKGVLQKFLQNPELAEKLVETGEQMIAECAVKDRIWGIGLSMEDEERFYVNKWKGQNLLGKILMQVRAEISVQNQNTEK